ncbi:peptidase C69 family protein [Marinigracilibium pacificum]|uniref:Peptidase U34 n=1 Tax=Marinigracilibium pacificum TaxID=2729599 RepID=A0A848IT81_9BACT|nr:peptidase U34 [Marinigracilibium pacificum]NMM47673.1 peptidase U34 [Marinigracilibium pacificum]
MCDTFTFFSKNRNGHSFFAKNSDRDPGEPQIIEIIQDANANFETDFLTEHLPKYNKQLDILKKVFQTFDHPYSAIISRPTWIWGAEMGINEKGVSIGNEAVFSKEKTITDGLLGMDILRLALHNSSTANEASNIITSLIETYGQGGNGSYSGSLIYHNSFLIKDDDNAIIIESSGKNWVRKDVTDFDSISNCYTVNEDYSISSEAFQDINLKKSIENKFYTFFSKGDIRQSYTKNQIENCDKQLHDVFEILRSHISKDNKFKSGMHSICVHPGVLVKSETTASMVVDYRKNFNIVWVTSSPNPCVSVFKPIILTKNADAFPIFSSANESLAYFKSNRKISEYMLRHKQLFSNKIKPLRDALQSQFIEIIYGGIENKTEDQLIKDCQTCFETEQEYKDKIKQLIPYPQEISSI